MGVAMVRQTRMAKVLLALACLVVLVCTSQRMAGVPQLSVSPPWAASSFSLSDSQEEGSAPAACSLGVKMLLSAPPLAVEHLALALLTFLLLLLCPLRRLSDLIGHRPPVCSPAQRRLHLRLCVFRE